MANRYLNLVKNIGFFTISNFATRLISFVLVPLYTSYLSRGEYGLTDLMNTTIWLVSPLVTLSIADAVLRYMINDKKKSIEYASVGLAITLLSFIILLLFLPLLKLPVFGGLDKWTGWVFVCCVVNILQSFLSNIARGCDETKHMVYASLLTSVVTFLSAVVCFVLLGMGIRGFFLSTFLGNLVGCLWYICIPSIRTFLRFPTRVAWRVLKPMLVYCVPLIPNALFWWINQSVNRFFITAQIGVAATGLFAAASRIPSFLNILSTIFQQAWNLTAFQEYESNGRQHFFSVVFRMYDLVLCIGTGILILCAQPLSKVLLRKSFAAAWIYVPLLLLSFYYSSLSAFLGSVYTASLKTRDLFITTFVGAGVCMLLTYLLVSKIGIIGACLASMLSNLIVFAMRMISSRRILKVDVRPFWLLYELIILVTMSWAVVYRGTVGFLIAICLFILLSISLIVNQRDVLKALFERINMITHSHGNH